MDEFLRDIYYAIFRQWISQQSVEGFQTKVSTSSIIFENDSCQGQVIFNAHHIIELTVINKKNQSYEFYLHFQLNNLSYALSLFNEMKETLSRVGMKRSYRVLLVCSGGYTTSYFAQKLNEAAQYLNLDMYIEASGYGSVFTLTETYDAICLAPQVSYKYAELSRVFKHQRVVCIPSGIFATYDLKAMFNFIEDTLKQHPQPSYKENLSFKHGTKLSIKETVLCLSLYQNNKKTYMHYRVYNNQCEILQDASSIKPTIRLEDIFAVIDTQLYLYKEIKKIAISIPGVVDDQGVHTVNIGDLNEQFAQRIKHRYPCPVIFSNDANTATLGCFMGECMYDSCCLIFQPIGSMAGMGTVIDGRLVTGHRNFAGEWKYVPLSLSASPMCLSNSVEGTFELITKYVLTMVSLISPPIIYIYSDLCSDVKAIKEDVEKALNHELTVTIKKISHLQEHILLGLVTLCME